ncbi:aquaporin [Lottiidibacillus patelloidae]|uniref:Aquaporin n=1 Tax=Lottiidibacillus patelloidae TaxID=2670334 RepID=A0A263BWR8_9BACI|nr:MIP family channel protein [Lottiidibacillus patelloidae]OZM58110.1 aquaporin [Lottiidibacillus patelloidae]
MVERKLLAEFIGTYFLVFAGTGAIIVNELTGLITHVGIALTFGLIVTVLIYSFGHVSGAHFNPAVTIGFLCMKQISMKKSIYYILVQIIGAICASLTLKLLFPSNKLLGTTLPTYSWQQSFLLEIILTFLLMTVIFNSAVSAKAVKPLAGIAIGATVGLEAMFAGPITGASMNPARSLGPALVSQHLSHLWIYVVATIIGAILAAVIYKILKDNNEV